MASRREFTFGSMLLALTGARTARAGIPELDVKPSGPSVDPMPKVDFAFAVSRPRKDLRVAVTVTNRDGVPLEVVAARGSMPGAYLDASIAIDGHRFELAVIYEGDRREIFSRAGPMPRFERLLAGASLQLGTYRFQWPDGVPDLPVQVKGGLDVDARFVTFERTLTISDRVEKAS